MRQPNLVELTLATLGLFLILASLLSPALGISAPHTFSLLRLIMLSLGIGLWVAAAARWLKGSISADRLKAILFSGYKSISYLFFNSVILFVVVNLLLGIILPVVHLRQEESQRAWVLYRDYFPTTYPDYEPQQVEALLRETWNLTQKCEPYTHFREAAFDGDYVNVDVNGFRHVAEQSAWPPDPNDYVIFFFGGSTTFGYGAADQDTIASRVQAQLRGSGLPVSVYNFGRGSYFSTQELILFQQLIREGYSPDAVIFIDGLNDFQRLSGMPKGLTLCADSIKWNKSPGAVTVDLPMLSFARELSAALYPPQNEGDAVDLALETPAYEDLNTDVIERWLANIQIERSIAATYGIEILTVLQPVPTYHYDQEFYPYLSPDSMHYKWLMRIPHGYEMLAEMKQAGDPSLTAVLDLSDLQADHHEMLYVDRVHYTAAFSTEIATEITRALQEIIAQP